MHSSHSATGREVFDWILDQGYYSERDTSNVIRQVLEAVAYLHSLQIVHRNLKAVWKSPFYDETDDDDYENHDKNLFRKILAGDYEFDSPYWDDISDSAKELVARLMEVDQDQRLTAQEAINHDWISGNAASDKNIKDGVCAQIEKNFAKAKWKKAVRVTTLMKRLRAPEQSTSASASQSTGPVSPVTPVSENEALAAAVSEAPGAEPASAGGAAGAPPADSAHTSPAPEEADSSSRCNGETPSPQQLAAGPGDELNG
ncbi:hypothetical protein GJAV_G00173680 [Gymnothorax javanicus]|nr:hypothetical protein GJAV_G00173680 [Gymnothorax javanicus]